MASQKSNIVYTSMEIIILMIGVWLGFVIAVLSICLRLRITFNSKNMSDLVLVWKTFAFGSLADFVYMLALMNFWPFWPFWSRHLHRDYEPEGHVYSVQLPGTSEMVWPMTAGIAGMAIPVLCVLLRLCLLRLYPPIRQAPQLQRINPYAVSLAISYFLLLRPFLVLSLDLQ